MISFYMKKAICFVGHYEKKKKRSRGCHEQNQKQTLTQKQKKKQRWTYQTTRKIHQIIQSTTKIICSLQAASTFLYHLRTKKFIPLKETISLHKLKENF